ncbi:MAG: DAK2 domain-containing protein [Syntrophomonadaceae bacterium]|nr:DAK2 domain-containing protein [Syntrophomonadaceae bacterium]
MELEYVTGNDLARMLKSGCIRLEHHKEQVNALNVFPVPDGDTGTNMYLTLVAAVREVDKTPPGPVSAVAKAISRGSLMGARGNSGVILSQVFRGLALYAEGKDVLSAAELAAALQAGADTAYKAVMRPVEGTILTVVREVAKEAVARARGGTPVGEVLAAALRQGERVLARTPQMLPILREAGVVDAGGQGFVHFLAGVLEAWTAERDMEVVRERRAEESAARGAPVELEYTYCTELLISGSGLDTAAVSQRLRDAGDSLLVVGDQDLVKVHVHTNHPGQVLETCLQFGVLSDIKINNMVEESRERAEKLEEAPAPEPEAAPLPPQRAVGVVAVASGEGVADILRSLGVDQVVDGGQTMNPSTEDLASACQRVEAAGVIILPNNSNVVMAAQQARHLCDRPVAVVPTASVMQGIAAMVAFDPQGELATVVSNMEEEAARIKWAVRDTTFNGLQIRQGDAIGLIGGVVAVADSSVEEAVLKVLERMLGEEDELITLLYGQDVSAEQAAGLKSRIEQAFPGRDVELHRGGQPHYHYFLSVE